VPREAALNLLAGPRGLRRALRRARPGNHAYDLAAGTRRALDYWAKREALFGKDFFRDKAVLEIGSGRTFGLALCALAAGATRIANIEISGEATVYDRRLYEAILAALAERGYPYVGRARAALRWEGPNAIPDGVTLVTRYGSNARTLEFVAESFDFVFSIAVLEHVRRGDMGGVLREIYRVLRPGGLASHRVDTCDHYRRHTENPLEFLRYPPWMYELMYSNRDSYSNRYRMSDFARLFERVGFRDIRLREIVRREADTVWRRFEPHLHRSFGGYSGDDLRVTSFLLEARRPSA
jgi:SAM-dependent methyltransferase